MQTSNKLKTTLIALSFLSLATLAGCAVDKTSPEEYTGPVREFQVKAFKWGFDPEIIEVEEGDRVILHLETLDVAHGLAINEFRVQQPILPGKSVTVDFIADKAGTYTFYCSVPCGVGHSDQKGTLIVKQAGASHHASP